MIRRALNYNLSLRAEGVAICSLFYWYYGLLRRYAPRNDISNLTHRQIYNLVVSIYETDINLHIEESNGKLEYRYVACILICG